MQVSWRDQMPKHEKINAFCWISWKVNTVCWRNLGSLYHITNKRKNLKIILPKLPPSSRPFCVCKELGTTSVGKINFEGSSLC